MAYKEAKDFSDNIEEFNALDREQIEDLILRWAAVIDPRNKKGYRKVPVTFANGAHGVQPRQVPRAMQSFSRFYANKVMEPVEAFTGFETIHLFEDGNGRLGDLLWKLAMTQQTGKWPEELPPDVFGDENK